MMAKYKLTEGIMENVVKFIFQMVADGKTAALQKKFAKDPQMIQYIKDTDNTAKSMAKHIADMKMVTTDDPTWNKL